MAGSLMMYTDSTTWHGGLDSPNHGCPRAQPVSGGPLTSREVHPDLQIHHVTAALQHVRSKEDFMGLPSHPKIMRTSKHHLMACLLEVEPMLDIVRADIDLHIRGSACAAPTRCGNWLLHNTDMPASKPAATCCASTIVSII